MTRRTNRKPSTSGLSVKVEPVRTVLRPTIARARALRQTEHGFGRALHAFRRSGADGLLARRRGDFSFGHRLLTSTPPSPRQLLGGAFERRLVRARRPSNADA